MSSCPEDQRGPICKQDEKQRALGFLWEEPHYPVPISSLDDFPKSNSETQGEKIKMSGIYLFVNSACWAIGTQVKLSQTVK